MNILKIRELVLEAGRPKIAVPIVSADPKEIIAECESIRQMPCQILEWRADKYLGAIENLEAAMEQKEFYLDIIKILDDINFIAAGMPIIFTVRSKSQGGDVQMGQEHIAEIRSLAAQSGLVDFIDIEFFTAGSTVDEVLLRKQIDEVHKHSCKVILSHHDFLEMPNPSELVGIVKRMANMGADICKVAAMASSKEDSKNLLKATAFLNKNDVGPMIMIAMGEHGKPARVSAGKYGSCITFASGKQESAPGQVDVYTMKKWLDDYYGGEEG